ncbi:MAG: hypothetical protein QF752_15990 [Planctomycetota bacterium]|jgi:hypothetical protein|nr:hypothetical protein [Planctomycetota bacterium]
MKMNIVQTGSRALYHPTFKKKKPGGGGAKVTISGVLGRMPFLQGIRVR